MSKEREMLKQIEQLSQAIQNHKKTQKPALRLSRNKTLVNSSKDGFVTSGNSLVRVGVGMFCFIKPKKAPLPIEPVPTVKRKRPVRPSKNKSLIQKEGILYTKQGNSLTSLSVQKSKQSDGSLIINGVQFVREARGRKLRRVGVPPSAVVQKTPRAILSGGKKYKRSKKGNLILVTQSQPKRKKKARWNRTLVPKKHCQFYRFGKVSRD